MQQQFDAQQERIQKLSDVVLESSKDTRTNADTLHNLLVGIENLGENVKNMQEEMIAWQAGYQEAEREYDRYECRIAARSTSHSTGSKATRSCKFPHQYLYHQFRPPSSQSRVRAQLPQFSAGPSMDDTRQSDWARLSALRKSYPSATATGELGSRGI